MAGTMELKLRQDDSRELLAELEKQDSPWELLYEGDGVFRVSIDGVHSAHTLDLSSRDGLWCMRTHIQI